MKAVINGTEYRHSHDPEVNDQRRHQEKRYRFFVPYHRIHFVTPYAKLKMIRGLPGYMQFISRRPGSQVQGPGGQAPLAAQLPANC